ncbi:MAG: arylsulfatase A-like enzyme [Verrucomicrobiales bacterium]|jgi:arylsulfatase A-like enzyme
MKRLLCFLLLTLSAASAEKPNVLFILADDLGWRDLSIEGSTFYESPNIDRIAKSGMRFTRGYAACQVCSPSRAAIMTGKSPARLKITDWIGAAEEEGWKRNTKLLPPKYNHVLPHDDVSMAEAFREGGYRTFFAGKWHLGGEGSFPEDHGFEINIGGHHRGSPPGGFFSPYNNPKMEDGPPGESLPVRLGAETAKFIDEHKDEPFFAYLAFYQVHAPIQTTPELWAKYQKKAQQLPAVENRFIVDRTSPVRQVQDHPVYAGMIEAMDDGVGLALEALDRNGLTDNTIIVFTSDNGGVSAGDGKATSNLPLRGGKGRQWEGGIREPFYIVAPGVAEPGSKSAVPAIHMDFYPTLLDLAGLDSRPDQHADGQSLVPVLKSEGEFPDRALFWHYPHYGNQGGEPSAIISEGGWKLIHYYEDDRRELYQIEEDQGEQKDVAAANPERVQAMGKRLMAWLDEMDANMPYPNPNFSPEKAEQEKIRTREKTLPSLENQAASFLKPDFVGTGGTWWGSKPKP